MILKINESYIKKYFKFLKVFPIILIVATSFFGKVAFSRNVEATFVFCATSGPAGNICPYYYAKPDEVYSMYLAWVATLTDIDFHPVAYYPNLTGGTTNGLPTRYTEVNSDGGQFDLGYRVPICPQSRYPNLDYHTIQNPNILSATCYGNEPEAPEPGCDTCQSDSHNTVYPSVGNPIYPSTGTKLQTEIDYAGAGNNELQFVRTYRSDKRGWTHNYQIYGVDFTSALPFTSIPCYYDLQQQTNWPRCFRYLKIRSSNDFMVLRGSHRAINFGTDTDLSPTADVSDRVSSIITAGVLSGYKVYNAGDESIEKFDTSGRLQEITSRSGKRKIFTYSDATTPVATAASVGLLIRVADDFGRSLQFVYDGSDRMVSMIDAGGGKTLYGYDESTSFVNAGRFAPGNLTSVTYPDGKKRLYWYNEQDKTGGADLPFSLTGITDELGVRFATFAYDTTGRAVSTEHAGGVEKFSVAIVSLWTTSTATDPLGTVRTYNFRTILGMSKSTGVSQPGPGGTGTVSTSIQYDDHGNVTRSTDLNGSVTTFSYDLARNLETSRVEAFGTPQARMITTEWHANYRLPTKIAEPQRLTTLNYDTSGNVLKRTVQATSDLSGALGTNAAPVGAARIVSYTYNGAGQVLTETGPRTDVANTTTYTYDAQGNLATVSDAANHMTAFLNYDFNGGVGRIVVSGQRSHLPPPLSCR